MKVTLMVDVLLTVRFSYGLSKEPREFRQIIQLVKPHSDRFLHPSVEMANQAPNIDLSLSTIWYISDIHLYADNNTVLNYL